MIYLLFVIGISVILGMPAEVTVRCSKYRKKYCIIMFLLLFSFAALRGSSVGIDTISRAYHYIRATRMTFKGYLNWSDAEIGYRLLVAIFSRVFKEPYYIEMVYAAFIIGVHLWFFNIYSDELPLTVELFIIFNFSATMNTTRQYLAISLFMIALHFIIQKKLKPAVVIMGIATLFHSSALVCFAFCILAIKGIYVNKKRYAVMIPLALGAIVGYSSILNLFLKLFPKYQHYLSYSFYAKSSNISVFWVSIYTAMIIIILHIFPSETTEVDDEGVARRTDAFSVISVLFLIYAACDITAFFLRAIYRIMRYFYAGFTILLPNEVLVFFKKNKFNRFLIYMAFFAMGLLIGYIEFKANKYRIFPYRFYWE